MEQAITKKYTEKLVYVNHKVKDQHESNSHKKGKKLRPGLEVMRGGKSPHYQAEHTPPWNTVTHELQPFAQPADSLPIQGHHLQLSATPNRILKAGNPFAWGPFP